MWRLARRYGALAYWNVSEALLRAVGRRRPYAILKLDLTGHVPEEPIEQRLFALPQRSPGDHFSLTTLLRWARDDPQLRAVLVRCGELRAGWAKIQELRRGLVGLRDAGKFVCVCLTQAGMPEYLLASAAQQIVLAPVGTLDIAGLSTEVTFVAGTLRKLGIEAELVQMGKYKSAAETFTRSDMSEAHREMVESLVHDLYEQIVEAVAGGRRMEPAQVRALLDAGPFVAREAERARLVDALLYEDQAEERLRARYANAAVIEHRDYFPRRRRSVRRAVLRTGRGTVGVLHVTGTVKMGESIPGPDGASACGLTALTRDLKALRERTDINAIVLRVSSPGGSGLASDLMWHEVARTRERKPVVVSCGDVAASGGYYLGVAGKPVIAEGATITGFIGVLAGKAQLRGLYDRVGVTKEVITRGRHAALYSNYVPLGEEERQRLKAEAEYFYAEFIDRVAAGRQLSHEQVEAVAQGRVWTGRQACARGLVDHLGGLERALEEAKVLAGLAPSDLVAVERYPKPRRLWKLSFNLSPRTTPLTVLAPWLQFLGAQRVWAIMPFHFRFF